MWWRAEATDLTAREREICNRIGPALKERGFLFVGIDVIGDYLTEINVTSPTGIREVKKFGALPIAKPALGRDREEARLIFTGPPLSLLMFYYCSCFQAYSVQDLLLQPVWLCTSCVAAGWSGIAEGR